MADGEMLSVQVCYATPAMQFLRDLKIAAGATVHDAIKLSGVLEAAPEIDLSVQAVGIFGKVKPLDTILRDRDRVEIYRPLKIDPKDARRVRAKKPSGR